MSSVASAWPTKEKQWRQLKAAVMVREFQYNGIRIPDPGPELTVEQVRDLLPITQGRYGIGIRPRSDRFSAELYI
jgi:hypothetical protein